jgi:hypothetical protein
MVDISSILSSVAFAHPPDYIAATHGVVVGVTQASLLKCGALRLRIQSVYPVACKKGKISRFEADARVGPE